MRWTLGAGDHQSKERNLEMKNIHLGHCFIGLALAAAVMIGLGVSASTLGILAIALMCPLMMMAMMRYRGLSR